MFYLFHLCQRCHMFPLFWTAYWNFLEKSLLYQLFHFCLELIPIWKRQNDADPTRSGSITLLLVFRFGSLYLGKEERLEPLLYNTFFIRTPYQPWTDPVAFQISTVPTYRRSYWKSLLVANIRGCRFNADPDPTFSTKMDQDPQAKNDTFLKLMCNIVCLYLYTQNS